jgi:mRNA interferase MazF
MGAIAVSKKEEEQIEKLRKELGIASKSAVIRTALKVLEKKSQEEKLRREIRDSVSRCAAADDREENKSFFRPPSPARAAANKCRSSAATYMLSISICASKQSRESFGPLVLQSDLVYEAGYPSTIVVPTTTRLVENPGILRLRIKQGQGGIARDGDLLLGQVIAVANESFRQEIDALPNSLMEDLENRIRIILNL